MSRIALLLAVTLAALTTSACQDAWNNPYSGNAASDNTLYTSFSERPKQLDPARSYTEDEAEFNGQIYEPPFQYHYLKRPYELIPLAATALPAPQYFDKDGKPLPVDANARDIARTVYSIQIRPGIRYAPHPAFVESNRALSRANIGDKYTLSDFGEGGTRELLAEDYVYQIKRLAHPRLNSPIFGHMADYITGLREYSDSLKAITKKLDDDAKKTGAKPGWLDLRATQISGVRVTGRHTYEVTIKGKYPQFLYWMAMSFFAPIPWEAEQFYAQPGMAEKNFSFAWYPVGTGPYMLTENNPNARMVLSRNPNFRGEPYPSEGEPGDREAGLLKDAGKMTPFLDRVVFVREKEAVPLWNKFLQGYYDNSGIASDNFDQAVKFGTDGEAGLTPEMEERGIRLRTSTATSSFYMAFNWLDPVVGGGNPANAARAKKLRQAISVALDYEEFISIFLNGRAIVSQGPVPPGIFGFKEGAESANPLTHTWSTEGGGKLLRRNLETAKKLLAEAGYPGGRDAKTGAPLVLALDTTERGPGDKPRFDWYRKQFSQLGIQLEIRGTDWNRFQEKIRKGNTQMFFLGWNADYPDPENFLFLLYGPNATKNGEGENKANYANAEFDRLFDEMKNMENSPARQAIIDKMMAVLRDDAPWAFGFHPKSYSLSHAWNLNAKPNQMARNEMKYYRIDSATRAQKRALWNPPHVWPFLIFSVVFALLAWLGLRAWRRFEAAPALARKGDAA